MDQAVLDSLQRWPNVPAVYGWLSLDKRGRWRLHPDQGEAQAITNKQILAFMDRNYSVDDAGCWFFQNGPQRVYVDLLGAPLILRLDDRAQGLRSHNGLVIGAIKQWWLDEIGQLWADTDQGPGLVDDRDLQGVLQRLQLEDGRTLLDAESIPQAQQVQGLGSQAALTMTEQSALASALGFVARPRLDGHC
ncbi:DUF2946 family protein [Bordetella holmesii]|uniref:PF11161 family protein n=2 Tax=Bordetella holmesii TaxID=35814 RepID=A0A158M0E1_9BORD|nr:DUF2946 family protein [Bordetella holmesii]AHV94575.1 hypothetical protein D560_0268 [Bordetella holmesii ATCC 51541]AIT24955.1 hypothetical protein D558_0264 [Bordetella holmesii 44057]EWM45517.1 hypothetical protein D557_3523 [Bordetella holmesii 70147]EWM48751.1 hypothetical protein D556_0267 [Bordetella holmesii 41130]EWM49643.1 hypothetical protein D555_0269 [Bordetella holmesii 35009]